MTAQAGLFVARDSSGNGTTAKGARGALAGLLAKNADGTVKVGVLPDGLGAVVSGAAGMTYNVRKFVAVTKASEANGPVLVPNDGTVSVATDPAPGSNSRIDVIYVLQRLVSGDGGSETTVAPVVDVAKGAVSASPVVPSIPAGALELARVTVPSGTVATSGLTFTQGAESGVLAPARYAPVPTPTVSSAGGPGSTQLIRQFHYGSTATDSFGRVAITFPTPFPNGILHVSPLTIGGTTKAPVVDGGVISKTGVTLLWEGMSGANVKFTYEAVGW